MESERVEERKRSVLLILFHTAKFSIQHVSPVIERENQRVRERRRRERERGVDGC